MQTAQVSRTSPPLWKLVAALLLFLALSATVSEAAEQGGLRLRGAGANGSSRGAPLSRDDKAPDKYGALNNDGPGSGANITPPDAALWDGEEDPFASPFAEPSRDGRTASARKNDGPDGRGQNIAGARRQEPVDYEAPFDLSRTPDRRSGKAVASAEQCPPPKRRGLRLRKKRPAAENTETIFGPSARTAQKRPAWDDPDFEPAAPPFIAEGEDDGLFREVARRNGDAASPAAPDRETRAQSASPERPADRFPDNTLAKKQDQERETADYGRDGQPPEAVPGPRNGGPDLAAQAPKTPQPALIPSNPPPARDGESGAVNGSSGAVASAPHSAFPGGVASAAAEPQAMPPRMRAAAPPPTRMEIEDYRRRLEMRLLERYNNLPEHAGNVGRVTVVLSKPLQLSLDGEMIRAEFDQLVFDPWGKRIPALEEEYYVVTFGAGGARQVRADPSIRVGLDLEKSYSERAPLNADPFSRVPEDRAFRPAPAPDTATVKMPGWWRPDFPELQ